MADEFELVFYQKKNGECPIANFIASLNPEMRLKMMKSMDKLEILGNRPQGDFSKYIGEGFFEIRAQNKTDISRIMFFFDKNKQVVLTHGFIKKTQRMPASELETAKRYRDDYFAREKEREIERARNREPEIVTLGAKWRPRLDRIIQGAEASKDDHVQHCEVRKKNKGQWR